MMLTRPELAKLHRQLTHLAVDHPDFVRMVAGMVDYMATTTRTIEEIVEHEGALLREHVGRGVNGQSPAPTTR